MFVEFWDACVLLPDAVHPGRLDHDLQRTSLKAWQVHFKLVLSWHVRKKCYLWRPVCSFQVPLNITSWEIWEGSRRESCHRLGPSSYKPLLFPELSTVSSYIKGLSKSDYWTNSTSNPNFAWRCWLIGVRFHSQKLALRNLNFQIYSNLTPSRENKSHNVRFPARGCGQAINSLQTLSIAHNLKELEDKL